MWENFVFLNTMYTSYCKCIVSMLSNSYSETRRTVKKEDDIKAIVRCVWWCYKATSFTCILFTHSLRKIGLFTLHICCVSCSLDYLKSYLESESHLHIMVITVWVNRGGVRPTSPTVCNEERNHIKNIYWEDDWCKDERLRI